MLQRTQQKDTAKLGLGQVIAPVHQEKWGGTGAVAQWWSTCLACARPWVHPQHHKKSDKEKRDLPSEVVTEWDAVRVGCSLGNWERRWYGDVSWCTGGIWREEVGEVILGWRCRIQEKCSVGAEHFKVSVSLECREHGGAMRGNRRIVETWNSLGEGHEC
jgi:hypothetical protein